MKKYSAKISLKGSRDNEVRRVGLSAAELLVLSEIHSGGGAPGVSEVKPMGKLARMGEGKPWTQAQERAYLIKEYGANFKKVLTSDFTPLPEEYVAIEPADPDDDDELPNPEELKPAIPGIKSEKAAKQSAALS